MAVGDEDWLVLGVAPGSPLEVARASYLRRAHLLHPDHHPDASPGDRARLDAAMAALNVAWDRIESRMATAPPPARTARSLVDVEARFPDGFVRTLALGRADRWSLRLWTDDLEPLHLLCHHRAAAIVGALDLHGRPVGDRHLSLLEHLPVLEMLDLSDTGVTDAGLGRLTALPRLRHLALAGTAISDRGLFAVAGCTGLVSLNLCDTAVTGESLDALTHLPLTTLNLRGTQVDGTILDALSTWPALRLLAVPHLERPARQRFLRERPDVTIV